MLAGESKLDAETNLPAASLQGWKGAKMRTFLASLLRDETGVTAIEYGLIAALISDAAVVVLGTVGTNLSSTFNTIAGKL